MDAFSSNDPLPPGPLPYADITNPQSLNKYAYTFNNPLRYTDPNGHCPGIMQLVCDWLNVVEVKGRAGYSIGAGFKAGPVESKYEKTPVAVEGKIGLGGGNGEANVVTEISYSGKTGPAQVGAKAGVDYSAPDGPNFGVQGSAKLGPVGGVVGADTTKGAYASPTLGATAKTDSRIGIEGTLGLGVGVNINLSQAARAAEKTAESTRNLLNFLANRLQMMGIPVGTPSDVVPKPEPAFVPK